MEVVRTEDGVYGMKQGSTDVLSVFVSLAYSDKIVHKIAAEDLIKTVEF